MCILYIATKKFEQQNRPDSEIWYYLNMKSSLKWRENSEKKCWLKNKEDLLVSYVCDVNKLRKNIP